MTKSIRERLGEISGDAIEGLVYIIGAIIVICIIIGFIVWQLIQFGQLFGVILGLITFSALLVTLYLYFRVEGSDENPSLALKLKVITTIIFFVFLIEAIITLVVFYSPIIRPIIAQTLLNASLPSDATFLSILVIGIFIAIVVLFLSIPVCLWTGICKASDVPDGRTPKEALLAKKSDETTPPTTCPACGTDLAGNEDFCGNCGVAITQE